MRSLVLLAALLLNTPQAPAAPIHRWVDERGVPHYSDRPAPGADSQALAARPAPSPGPSQATTPRPTRRAAAEQRRFEALLRRDARREAHARQQRCQQLAEHLELLQTGRRLNTETGGERRPLSEAERRTLIESSRERWRVSCAR